MQDARTRKIALALAGFTLAAPTIGLSEGDTLLEGPTLVTPLDVDGGRQLITVVDIGEDVGVFEGDVLVPLSPGISSRSTSVQAQSASVALAGSLWPDGIAPYAFDSSLDNAAKTKIIDAIAHWNANTPVQLIARTNETDYINFVDQAGCASYIGRIGGPQPVYSSPNCSVGNFIHEIGHALGLYHEHTRPDRDTYVTINWGNISSGKSQNFDIVLDNVQVNTPYDYGSIMHYGETFFTTNGQNTITPTQSGASIGQRVALSNSDIDGINELYSSGFQVDLDLYPPRPMPGSSISATIEVSNILGSTINTLEVSSTLPANVSFTAASGTGWSCSTSGQDLDCSGPNLSNSANTELTIEMSAPNSVANLDFSFNVTGMTSAGMSLDNDALRSLTMTAVNDPPEIELGQDHVAVVPLTSVEAPISSVKAEDPNGHTLSNYSLVAESHPGVFRLDSDTGGIYAVSASAVNALDGETATLGVIVSDGFENSTDTTVEIRMLTAEALANQSSSPSMSSGGGGGSFLAYWLILLLPARELRASLLRNSGVKRAS